MTVILVSCSFSSAPYSYRAEKEQLIYTYNHKSFTIIFLSKLMCTHTHTRKTHAAVFYRDRGRRLLPWYQVAGLSDTMVRSCPAAWPERAEQWSRSADGAAESTTNRSVSLAELHRLLQPRTLSSHIQWRVGGQEREEMEGNSPHAIIKQSPLFWNRT